MPVAARQNQVAEHETPISSSKYNEEINNLYLYVNRLINRFQSATPPENPLVNNVWLDTSSEPAVLRSYNGSTWVWAGVYAGSTAPENPSSGALFVDTDTWDMHVFDGTLGGWINLLDAMSEEIATMLETMAGYLSDAEDYTAQAFGYKEPPRGVRAAVAAESLAEKWASENVNVVVADGKYSAKHWATKAEDYAGTGSGVFEVYEGKNQSIDARILNMRNERVENLGSPSADTDAATKGYADSVGSAAQGYADTLVPAPTEDGQVFTSDSGAGVWANPPSGLPDIERPDEDEGADGGCRGRRVGGDSERSGGSVRSVCGRDRACGVAAVRRERRVADDVCGAVRGDRRSIRDRRRFDDVQSSGYARGVPSRVGQRARDRFGASAREFAERAESEPCALRERRERGGAQSHGKFEFERESWAQRQRGERGEP